MKPSDKKYNGPYSRKKSNSRPPEEDEFWVDESFTAIASATECTGLEPSAIVSDSQADAYRDIYDINKNSPTHFDAYDDIPEDDSSGV